MYDSQFYYLFLYGEKMIRGIEWINTFLNAKIISSRE